MSIALSPLVTISALTTLLLGTAAPARGQCPMSFAEPASYPTGPGPGTVVAADFDADGDLDLAVVNSVNDTLSILLGANAGTFQPGSTYPVATWVGSAATADLDADGNLDLLTSGGFNGVVSVLLGNGDGTFQPMTNHTAGPPGGQASFAALGDFDSDGRVDAAVANLAAAKVSLLRGKGDGTFHAPVSYPVGAAPMHVALGDLDGDGALDVVVSNFNADTVSVLLGDGDGALAAASDHGVGASPFSTVLGDFNGDGNVDIAAANSDENTVSVLLGTGNGAFQAAVGYPVGGQPLRLAAADLNADGTLDLAVPNQSGDTLSILAGTGNGTFMTGTALVPGASASAAPGRVTIADLNSDGRPDLVVSLGNHAKVAVLLNSHSNANPPVFLQQPAASTTVPLGSAVSLFVIVDVGGGPATYQWRRNGSPIADSAQVSGATTPTLAISSVQLADSGVYDVTVKTPACGGGFLLATSKPGVIAVSGCSGDINGDGTTDSTDLGLLLGSWGLCP